MKQLSQSAQQLEQQGDERGALEAWRDALALLPPESKQASQIGAQISTLSAASSKTQSKGVSYAYLRKYGLILGGIGLLIWKFKFVALLILSKGKFLLLGLTKSTTITTMALSLSVYWLAFGWVFALGLVVSLYIHEMGHVYALNRLGIRSSAPMFIPGLGAMVRMHHYPNSAAEDAAVGLAGPIWGMAAAAVAWVIFALGGGEYWGAIARVGAWINLLNLAPVWQLDGSRGFRALTVRLRVMMLLLVVGVALLSGEGLLWLIVIAGVFSLRRAAPKSSDARATITFAALIIILSWIAAQPLPSIGQI